MKVVSLKADNNAQFERMMGWERGELERVCSEVSNEKLLEVLQRFCDVSARWLLFGEGFPFGEAKDGIVQKLAMLANLERYVPVMTDEERERYEEAISVREYTDYAISHINVWENRLSKVKIG